MGWSVRAGVRLVPEINTFVNRDAARRPRSRRYPAASVLLFLHVVAGYAVPHREQVSAILLSRLLILERSNLNALRRDHRRIVLTV